MAKVDVYSKFFGKKAKEKPTSDSKGSPEEKAKAPKGGGYGNFFGKRISFLLNGGKNRKQEKMAFYLKLYTNLIMAESKLNSARGFDHLRIVRVMTREESYQNELHYLKYVSSITSEIMSKGEIIRKILRGDPTADPLNAKTKLLMAQNICVLRILKIGSG